MPDSPEREALVMALHGAGHTVAAFSSVAALMANPPEETCDILMVPYTEAHAQGLESLAEVRAMAPMIPALILGYDLGLEAFVRALRLGVVDVVPPNDFPRLLERVEFIRRVGAVAALTQQAEDRLARVLVETLESAEQRNEAEAAQLEGEHRKLQEEIAKLNAYEAKLRAQDKHLRDLQEQVQQQAARRGGPGMTADWEKLERMRMRLDAEQRNFLTEKIVLQEEMNFLKKRVTELTPFQTAHAELQSRIVASEQELARRRAALDRRELEIVRREASLGLVAAAGNARPGLLGSARSALGLTRR